VPWQRSYQTPTATVVSTWREAVGPRPLQQLRDRLLAAASAERQERDWPAVAAGDLDACSIDGSLVRAPDWIGSETSLKEAKSTINGAGPSIGPMLRSATPA
jgi:hypothetical protein